MSKPPSYSTSPSSGGQGIKLEVNRFQDISRLIMLSELDENLLLGYSEDELPRIIVNSPILAPSVYTLSPKLVAKNFVAEVLDDSVRAMEIAYALGIRVPSTGEQSRLIPGLTGS
jgi:hypothetical protein